MHAVLTSARGDAQRVVPLSALCSASTPIRLEVRPDRPRQQIHGIGSSLTQASAVALSTLSAETRRQVLQLAFGSDRAGFSLVRTHIGSCDFSTSSYTYLGGDDPDLSTFSLAVDQNNGHLDLLHDAAAVEGAAFSLIASPWTAPPFMKDNGRFFDPEQRRGGRLLPEHRKTFARYTARYCEEMARQGLPIWALTPVNEPHGNQGTWESMEMSPAEQAAYVSVLGDTLARRGLNPKILIYDQNRKGMRNFAEGVFSDPAAGRHAWGTAVHWYDSTFRVYEDELEALHAAWPNRPIIQTEGCIDNVFSHGEFKGPGAPTPGWRKDDWFWDKVATDWGWDWAENPEVDHPPYAAAFRYARDLVGGLAHRLAGWVDWNLVLTRGGGPNHVGNFCLAPILVDGAEVYLTPLFHILSQVSAHTRPGAVVLETEGSRPDTLWLVALQNPTGSRVVHFFNESQQPQPVRLSWGTTPVTLEVPSAALATVVLGDS